MANSHLAEMRGIVEPRGKSARRAAEIVATIKSLPQLLSELKNITDASGESAHRAAELVGHLINLPEWIDEQHGGLRDAAERELDRLCRMIALTLNEMLLMIKWFPEQRHWHKADLCKLRDNAEALQAREDAERKATDRARLEAARPKPQPQAPTPRIAAEPPRRAADDDCDDEDADVAEAATPATTPATAPQSHESYEVAHWKAEAARYKAAYEREAQKRRMLEVKVAKLEKELGRQAVTA